MDEILEIKTTERKGRRESLLVYRAGGNIGMMITSLRLAGMGAVVCDADGYTAVNSEEIRLDTADAERLLQWLSKQCDKQDRT